MIDTILKYFEPPFRLSGNRLFVVDARGRAVFTQQHYDQIVSPLCRRAMETGHDAQVAHDDMDAMRRELCGLLNFAVTNKIGDNGADKPQ